MYNRPINQIQIIKSISFFVVVLRLTCTALIASELTMDSSDDTLPDELPFCFKRVSLISQLQLQLQLQFQLMLTLMYRSNNSMYRIGHRPTSGHVSGKTANTALQTQPGNQQGVAAASWRRESVQSNFYLKYSNSSIPLLIPYWFQATSNRKMKDTIALELSFVNSNLQLLKEKLSELNSSVEIYQHERFGLLIFNLYLVGL